MAAITRPNYVRGTPASTVSYDASSESAGVVFELDGETLPGPLGLFEVRAKKTAGGADNTTIRVYADDTKAILLYEQVHAFTGDNAWVAYQLPRDVVVRSGEEPVVTAEAGVGSGHSMVVYASFTVAAVQ